MTVDMWNEYKLNGIIMSPYTMVRSLGADKASVLSQVISEFNYAHNNNLNFYDDFLFSPQRMSSYLGLTQEQLLNKLNELEQLNFIQVFDSDIEDTKYMRVNQQEIINFKQKVEQENMYGSWDLGLKRSQNPIHKKTNFCQSAEQIKKYLDEHMQEPEKIPLVMYSYASSAIEDFEEKTGQCILNNPNIMKSLDMLAKSTAPRQLFEIYINKFNIQEE